MDHPEIVVQGLPQDTAHGFLDDTGNQVKSGRRFSASTFAAALAVDDLPMAFLAVLDTSELTAVEQVYGHVDALQLVWPDNAGAFPWQPDYGLPPDAQLLLGIWPQ